MFIFCIADGAFRRKPTEWDFCARIWNMLSRRRKRLHPGKRMSITLRLLTGDGFKDMDQLNQRRQNNLRDSMLCCGWCRWNKECFKMLYTKALLYAQKVDSFSMASWCWGILWGGIYYSEALEGVCSDSQRWNVPDKTRGYSVPQ